MSDIKLTVAARMALEEVHREIQNVIDEQFPQDVGTPPLTPGLEAALQVVQYILCWGVVRPQDCGACEDTR